MKAVPDSAGDGQHLLQCLEAKAFSLSRISQSVIHDGLFDTVKIVRAHLLQGRQDKLVEILARDAARRVGRHQRQHALEPLLLWRRDGVVLANPVLDIVVVTDDGVL